MGRLKNETMPKQTKDQEYTVKILSQIQQLFNDPDCENHIDLQDFSNDKNLKYFLYALSCVVPSVVYGQLSGDEKNYLEHNHVANQLCFEYMNKA